MTGRVYVLEKDTLSFRVAYDPVFVKFMKTLKGKWRPLQKEWSVKIEDPRSYKILKNIISIFKIKTDEEVEELLRKTQERYEKEEREKEEIYQLSYAVYIDKPVLLPEGKRLYDFQKVAVEYLERKKNVLISDEMGLGKTVEVLSYFYNHKDERPVLFVVPATMKLKWKQEIEEWCPEPVQMLYKKRADNLGFVSFYIINYEILSAWLEALKKKKWAAIVFDECHYLKNPKAKRTKAAKDLVKTAERVIALSGTPLLNRPIELFPVLKMLNVKNKCLKDYWYYIHKFCDARQEPWGLNVRGASNLGLLQKLLREEVMLRRRKEDVLTQLPEKNRILIPVELEEKKFLEYDYAERDFVSWYKKKYGSEKKVGRDILIKIEFLRQLVNELKKEYVIKIVRDILDSIDGEKIVIFAHHRKTQQDLAKDFNALHLAGNMIDKQKKRVIDTFMVDKDQRVLVASLKAAGLGIDLHAANTAVFAEIHWSPSDLIQAEDRLHRIGQKKSVTIYYCLAANTLEYWMWDMIQRKAEILRDVLDTSSGEEEIPIKYVLSKMLERYS